MDMVFYMCSQNAQLAILATHVNQLIIKKKKNFVVSPKYKGSV